MDVSNITLENIIKFIKDNNYLDKSMIDDIENISNDKNDDKKMTLLQYGNSANFESISPKIDKMIGMFYKSLSHVGVIRDLDSQNVSLCFSVLFCMDSDFRMKTIDLQLESLNQFYQYILNNLNDFYISREEKKNVRNDLKIFNNSDNVINLLARCFTINIWIIDSEKESVSVSNNNLFDENRKNIILIKHDKYYEPIIYDSNYYYDTSIKIIKILMNNIDNVINVSNNNDLWKQNLKIFIPSKLLNNLSFDEITKDEKKDKPATKKENKKNIKDKENNDNEKRKNIFCDESEKIKTIETNINELTYGEDSNNTNEDAGDDDISDAIKEAIQEENDETSESENETVENQTSKKKVSKEKKICNTRMKLGEIQEIAKENKIDINKKGSNGKIIRKTKIELIEEINNI